MSDVFFTSDLHLGHARIIELSHRPFSSVEEMDEILIQNWNSRVGRNDRVYFLGDFAFHRTEKIGHLLRCLNGQIHCVKGNHDSGLDSFKDRFASYGYYKTIKVDGHHIVLCHYPFAEWDRAHRGAWHLHGHQHGNGPTVTIPRLDVGVDCFDYQPVSFEEVRNIMLTRQWVPLSHH